MQKKNLLIVDDEKLFLKSVVDGLKPFQESLNCNVLTANNGREAMNILDKGSIDVVVTDIRMPEADGFKLISHMINNHATIPVVVMTAFGSQDIEKRVREMGIIRYLEKPVDFDHFLKTIEDVLSLNKKEGRIEGIAISTFLQMMEMEKITCTLTITSHDRIGKLYIKNGNLIEAEHLNKRGKEAALEILAWDNVKINMKEVCKLKEGVISQTLTSILLESFKRLDANVKKGEEKEKDKVKTKEFVVVGKKPGQVEPQVVDVARLNKAVEALKKNLAGGLLATDIFHVDTRQSVCGWNSNPGSYAILGDIARDINDKLGQIGYPALDRYLLFDLADFKILIAIPFEGYLWCILADSRRTQLGLLLNLVTPQAIAAFGEARGK